MHGTGGWLSVSSLTVCTLSCCLECVYRARGCVVYHTPISTSHSPVHSRYFMQPLRVIILVRGFTLFDACTSLVGRCATVRRLLNMCVDLHDLSSSPDVLANVTSVLQMVDRLSGVGSRHQKARRRARTSKLGCSSVHTGSHRPTPTSFSVSCAGLAWSSHQRPFCFLS